ncbi:MAG: cell division protein SepF [Candidatus Woesearchaeota archaeon]
MKHFFNKIKEKVKKWGFDDEANEDVEEEYLELDAAVKKSASQKIVVRPFVLDDFSDVKDVVDTIREGYSIALVNIKVLKEKDMVELRRAINKLKKTCDAIGGDIAGVGEDYIVVTPSFAEIYRTKENQTTEVKEDKDSEEE